jgi:hypothetical protein
VLLVGPEAGADGYSECNQILTQDIFNRAIRTDSSDSAASAETRAAFYQQTDTEAWDAFEKARSEAKKNGTKIDTEFHYGIIGGELGIDLNPRGGSESGSEKFNKAKATYSSSSSSKTSSSQSLRVTMRATCGIPRSLPGRVCHQDAGTTSTRLPPLPAGKTFINVIWIPGPLAGSVPASRSPS